MARDTQEMRIWLFDLAHGNLKNDQIVKGFIKHYALHGLTINHVQDDIVFRTIYADQGVRTAVESLKKALGDFIWSKEIRPEKEKESAKKTIKFS